MIVPIFGTGTKGKSANVTSQRRINLYAERFANPDKSAVVYYPRPGLLKGFNKANTGSSFPGGPVRGIIVFIAATGTESIYIAQGKTTGLASTSDRFLMGSDYLVTSSGPVQMAALGVEVLLVDGYTIYRPSSGDSLTNLGVANVPTRPRSICTLAGRWIVDDQASIGRFRWSGLYDSADWDPLNFATAESASDPLIQVFERGGELLLFGTTSLEFWAPTGGADVFARVGGAGIDWGLGVFDSPRKANNTVLFIGRNLGGQPQVVRLDGYQAHVVSTPDVDRVLNDALDTGVSPTTSVVTHSGHTWYIVNLADTSLAYDVDYNEWSEWQTSGARWAGNYSSQYRDTAIVTDYRDGRVYYLDDKRYTDGDEMIARQMDSRHIFVDLDRFGLARMTLDMETGVGVESGQGSDPKIMLQVSRDGGHTFGNEMWTSLGALGKYAARVVWRRLGMARDMVFRFRVTDPVKTVFINAALEVEKE